MAFKQMASSGLDTPAWTWRGGEKSPFLTCASSDVTSHQVDSNGGRPQSKV